MLRKWDSASCLGHEPSWAQHQGVSDGMQPENVLLPCTAAWFCSSLIDLASDRIQRTCKPSRLSEALPWNPGHEDSRATTPREPSWPLASQASAPL